MRLWVAAVGGSLAYIFYIYDPSSHNFSASPAASLAPAVLAIAAVCIATIMFSDTLMGSVDMATASIKSTTMNMFGSSVASDYPEDQRQDVQRMERLKVGGLYNEGNTCFMNSVIQSFTSVDHLTQALGEHQERHNGVSRALLTIIKKLERKLPSRHVYSTDELIRSLEDESRQRWSGYDQEDAQEFFQQMMSALEKDWDPKRGKKEIAAASEKESAEKEASANSEKPRTDPEKATEEPKLVTPFDGVCYTRVGCLRCGEMEGLRQGVISSIDLSLQSMSGAISIFQAPKPIDLEQLLGDYCHMEIISGVECYRCSLEQMREEVTQRRDDVSDPKIKDIFQQRIDQLQEALAAKVIDEKDYKKLRPSTVKILVDKSKQTMFGTPMAPVLMVHINRSVFDIHTGYSRKNHRPVRFPLKLDMSRFVVDKNDEEGYKNVQASMRPVEAEGQSLIYGLKAAIVHIGSHNFGHYECYRKCDQGYWWRISDDSVMLTKESTVLNAQGAFMLFYERCEDNSETKVPAVSSVMIPDSINGSSVTDDRHDPAEVKTNGSAEFKTPPVKSMVDGVYINGFTNSTSGFDSDLEKDITDM